jgi:hypothetical protein
MVLKSNDPPLLSKDSRKAPPRISFSNALYCLLARYKNISSSTFVGTTCARSLSPRSNTSAYRNVVAIQKKEVIHEILCRDFGSGIR